MRAPERRKRSTASGYSAPASLSSPASRAWHCRTVPIAQEVPLERPRVTAVCAEAVSSPHGKRSFLRVHLENRGGQQLATPVSGSGSHLLAGLARANALVVVPEEVERIGAGDAVDVMVLERRGR